MMPTSRVLWFTIASAAIAANACSSNDPDPNYRKPGQTEFVSADGRPGQQSQNNDDRAGAPEDAATNDEERTVEEGDIYRVSPSTGHLLNLNAYRGLQIIDIADVTRPAIVGRLQMSGYPVEMYQVGNRIYALLNNWYGYYGARDDVRPETYQGGVVVAIDASNPAAPQVLARAEVPGYIRTSRLTRGNGQEALFVVASNGDQTYVRSFDVSAALSQKSEIDLGGWVVDAQATRDYLLVARHDWTRSNGRSDVAVIDIRDPSGTMVLGAPISAEGYVQKKTNLDVVGNVLRIVSGASWNGTATNHVETFDISNLASPVRIDHATFGEGEQLFATLFLEDRAFFVTYQRVDPFHTFRIDMGGRITPVSEFVVSGWNDWFKPVFEGRRLIGVGRNDQSGWNLALSLYDIDDLANPNPLLSRQEIDLSWSWSEANWDDRAFSIVENATSIAAADGTIETGLVLLPYSGWNEGAGVTSAVQIFTFSNSTLTKRGVMEHGTPVRRSFLAGESTTANLSDAELALYDVTNPDSPAQQSRIDLAPNYNAFYTFGGYGVRRKSNLDWWSWWSSRVTMPDDVLEIVDLNGDIDLDAPIASIAVPAGANIFKLGDRLAAVSSTMIEPGNETKQPTYETSVRLFDLSTPAAPRSLGALTTRELPPSWSSFGWWGPYAAFSDMYWGWWGSATVQVVDGALIFVNPIYERELEGNVSARWIGSTEQYDWSRCWGADGAQSCTYYSGGIYCSTLTRVDGTEEDEVCSGSFYRCTQNESAETSCEEIDQDEIETQEHTYTYEQYRYWTHWDLRAVDVRGESPQLAGSANMAVDEEAAGVLAKGSKLFLSYRQPQRVAGDSRSYVRYYFRELDFADPANPAIGANINIPGMLMAVEGNTLVTRDTVWGERIVETAIARLHREDNVAVLDATRTFSDRLVQEIALDGAGHVLVSHRDPSAYYWDVGVRVASAEADAASTVTTTGVPRTLTHSLSILDLESDTLATLGEVAIDDWASLSAAFPGRALYSVPGGMLVVNISDASAPFAQAYFSMNGGALALELVDRDVIVAAGRYGLIRFDIDTFNLLGE
jgi:hypothetical protein